METIDVAAARRLALVRAGLLLPRRTGLPLRGRTRKAAHAVIDRFGYLQLDTVSVAGARSHALVLLSRLEGFPPHLGEALLKPGEPLFEYWGHEVCWMPMSAYPDFAFRRQGRLKSTWCREVHRRFKGLGEELLRRVREDGPLKSSDLEGDSRGTWWDHKPLKRVAVTLFSEGRLAVRERKAFQRTFDLPERVIPAEFLNRETPRAEAFRRLFLKAFEGHGWATSGTLARTWRMINLQPEIKATVRSLEEEGRIVAVALRDRNGKKTAGWIRPEDLELADSLKRLRPRRDRGVLLSPFDPVLWERPRVLAFFDFSQKLEIFTPEPQREFGYFCLPVLAGEDLVARIDLKADRKAGTLSVLALHYEEAAGGSKPAAEARRAVETAVERYADAVELKIKGALKPARKRKRRR